MHREKLTKKRMIIFDLDGTIADTVDAGVAIYNTIAQRRGYVTIRSSNREDLRGLDTRSAIRALGIPWWRIPYVAARIRNGLVGHIVDIPVYDGMKEVLDTLAKHHTLVLVTSNSRANAHAFLKAHDITHFSNRVYAGVGIFGKARKLRHVLAETQVAAAHAVYIGDEVRDVVAAHAVGMSVIAVTWGLNTEAALAHVRPEHIAHTAGDIVRFSSQVDFLAS